MSGMKLCAKCGVAKPLTEFHRTKVSKDGHKARCKLCLKEDNALYYIENMEAVKARGKDWRTRNPHLERLRRTRFWENNKETERQRTAAFRKANPEVVREWRRRAEAKSRATPKGRLEDAIRAGVNRGLKSGGKTGKRTFDVLGYSSDELITHLERLFQPGMSWENYGRGGWHVDHKVPLAAHNYETPNDTDFGRAWALSNLQPMWDVENKIKHASLRAPFQPSFAFGQPKEVGTYA